MSTCPIIHVLALKSCSGCSVYEELNQHLTALAKKRQLGNLALLSRDFHVLPDFHGNRSPVADPNMTGMVRLRNPSFVFSFLC